MAKRELIEPKPGANVQGERLLHLSDVAGPVSPRIVAAHAA